MTVSDPSCYLRSLLHCLEHAALIFAVAPLPNFLCSRCVGDDSFSGEYSSGPVDFGHFVTSVLLVSGLALPTALAHSGVIHEMAGWMSAVGGVVGYLTSESGISLETPLPHPERSLLSER